MKNILKISFILGALLLVFGGVIFTVGMCINGWDFSKISNVYYEQKTYENSALGIENIVIEVDTEDVEFLTVDSDKITVLYSNAKNKKGEIISEIIPSLNGNTLNLKEIEKFALTFGLISNDNKVTVKIPSSMAFSINVETSTGNIFIGEQNKETTYSKIDVETNTGDLKVLGKIICNDSFNVELDTGSILCDGEIDCKNNLSFGVDTGKIVIRGDMSANSIFLETDTGDVLCKSAITANTINVKTSTGDVTLILKGVKEDYSYYYETSTGKSNIASYIDGSKKVRVETSTGDVNISFKK